MRDERFGTVATNIARCAAKALSTTTPREIQTGRSRGFVSRTYDASAYLAEKPMRIGRLGIYINIVGSPIYGGVPNASCVP